MKKLQKFAVFCNLAYGEWRKAKDINDLFNRMSKRQLAYWSHIEFKDEQDNTIHISRWLLEQGMSIEDCINDWKLHCSDQFNETIYAI